MATQQPFPISQAVMDLLTEEMKIRFVSVQKSHPERWTLQFQEDGQIFVDVWAKNNQWIMRLELSPNLISHLEQVATQPQMREQHLKFLSEAIN